MNQLKKHMINKKLIIIISLMVCTLIFSNDTLIVFAEEKTESVEGEFFHFDDKNKYDISSSDTQESTKESNFGKLSVIGDVNTNSLKEGIPTYEVNSGNVKFTYSIDSRLIKAKNEQWHLVEDKCNKIDGIKTDKDILTGALILQTSLTGEDWITDAIYTDIAGEKSDFNPDFYTTKEIQQVNGCYYRILVVHKEARQLEDKKVLFVGVDNFEYMRCAEVYKFFITNSAKNTSDIDPAAIPRKELGTKIKTSKDSGFFGEEEITQKDPHYGWEIGTFFINGYTRETQGKNGESIFLKNVGDRVTLWFNLKQDINKLDSNEKNIINEDVNGSDQYFEIEKTNFKHGALIIRYTDYEGKKHDPIIYTDYLAANTRTGADTKVELFEEGDYEVSLDYEIKNTSGIASYTNYKVFFTFSIRNGNCMVYPFDISTGAELADKAITQNGFKLDMAKSRYLTIDVTHKSVKQHSTGFSEDTRFNRPAKDGDEYKDEGIYTFTVKNLYTEGEPTTKTIYVGDSPILKALSFGNLTIQEVNEQINEGAELSDDGKLIYPEPETIPEMSTDNSLDETTNEPIDVENDASVQVVSTVIDEGEEDTEHRVEEEQNSLNRIPVLILGVATIVIIGILVLIRKRHYKKSNNEMNDNGGER